MDASSKVPMSQEASTRRIDVNLSINRIILHQRSPGVLAVLAATADTHTLSCPAAKGANQPGVLWKALFRTDYQRSQICRRE
eukprot:1158553-Pelagomonas_calceolata.AAC.8